MGTRLSIHESVRTRYPKNWKFSGKKKNDGTCLLYHARDHLIISQYGIGDTNIVAFDSSKGICLFLPYLELADEAHSPKPTTLYSLVSVHSDQSL